MQVRTTLAALAVTASALAAGSVIPAHAATTASTTACKTTRTYSDSYTSTGSHTQRWTIRTACGRDYTKYEYVIEHSYTGSHYIETIRRNEMSYPRYRQVTDKWSWSKKGTETYTVTIKTG